MGKTEKTNAKLQPELKARVFRFKHGDAIATRKLSDKKLKGEFDLNVFVVAVVL